MKKIIFIFLVLIISCPVFSQEDYADLNLKVDDKGIVYFSGTTNYEPFNQEKSEYFTSKKGPYWLLNITTKEKFSDYYIAVEFPKNTEINYIKTAGSFRITETPNLKLITTGKNEPVEIVVQYVLISRPINYLTFAVAILLSSIVILILFFFSKHKKPKQEKINSDKTSNEKLNIIKHTLTENQKLILEVLLQTKEPISQKQLQHRTSLPKATLSRNLELLKQKNIISKQSRGMVNVIFLNDAFMK
jgi:uncharacterized membrane protein